MNTGPTANTGLTYQLRVLSHVFDNLRSSWSEVYKGGGKCGIDAQMTKGLAITSKTGFFQLLIGEFESCNGQYKINKKKK